MLKRDFRTLRDDSFDLLIVGGGIFGAAAAWEAASRGLSVALIEKDDFGHASSANHLKMVHGGIRYIQHADIVRVRESCKERSALLRIAPHLVAPFPVMMPTYGHGMKGKEVLRVGMALYDLVTFDRNKDISDISRTIPRCSFLSRDETLRMLPGVSEDGLTGAAVFHDGQMYNPPRLALSFLRSAVNLGAVAFNYLALTDILINGGKVRGAVAKDVCTGKSVSINCKSILLATGGWTNSLLKKSVGLTLSSKPSFSRDLAFVVNRPLVSDYGFACPLKTKDADSIFDRGGRHLFVAPWRGKTLVGVWHGIFDKSPDEVATTEDELTGFLDEVNLAHPGFNLKLSDISLVLTGLTLFGDENQQSAGEMSFGKRSMLIDHERQNNIKGLVSLIGVRATVARGMASKAVKMISKKIDRQLGVSMTTKTPIFGGDFTSFEGLIAEITSAYGDVLSEDAIYSIARNYGKEYSKVLQYALNNEQLLKPIGSTCVLGAEIVHAVREEMAVKLTDVVFRRTDLGTTGGVLTSDVEACGHLMAEALSWDEEVLNREVLRVSEHLARRGYVNC
jgi:glycerol-3-phosphate dehydrogenase